ncbi:MAG: Rieske 2Fe-2S domain-containing protein [Candidatus Sumerlaeia bacterium]|nr:Rieske 2Fe-2S domain-containing protein [Candidatus Sumerlaeia bacterium]
MTPQPVARVEEIPDGGSIRRVMDGRDIAIFRKGEEIFAIDARCPHRGGPLDNDLEQGYLTFCPWHGWSFDVRTGKSPDQPGRVFCYEVTVKDGTIHIGQGV